MYTLGRLPAEDPNDLGYPMRQIIRPKLPTLRLRQLRYWLDKGFEPDQGDSPHCVEYAWHNWLAAKPIFPAGTPPYWPFGTVYHEAQLVDEWPGEDYDGTSVRAGAKVLKTRGYISNYYWTWDADELADAILHVGPVVVGTNWYSDMFEPDKDGIIKVEGFPVGGHAYTLTGVNKYKGMFHGKNSWGTGWGKSGRFRISMEDMQRLLLEDGEACLATEVGYDPRG
jgi:hypothetical protein